MVGGSGIVLGWMWPHPWLPLAGKCKPFVTKFGLYHRLYERWMGLLGLKNGANVEMHALFLMASRGQLHCLQKKKKSQIVCKLMRK